MLSSLKEINSVAKKVFDYEGKDLEAMDFAVAYHSWILSVFAPYLGEAPVEIGAGSGSFTELMAALKPKRLTGVEPSEQMYPLLVKTLAKIENDLNIKTDTKQAFFGDVSKDIKKTKPSSLVYINVFEHIENDRSELKAIYETLPSGGHVCIFVPANQWLMSNFDRKIGHFRRYSKKDLVAKAQEAGFEIVTARRFDFMGVLPWLITFRILRVDSIKPGMASLYDKVVVPVERIIERHVQPPVGKNVLLVAKKP